ncbi:MAG: ZIP family metal transporter [Candidatus Micrarchaeota archaeon]
MVLEYIIAATVLVSLISLIGILILQVRRGWADRLLFFFVSFAAGTFLGAAFLDLLPEALEACNAQNALYYTLGGILVFFIIEKVVHWHHHHSMHKKSEMHGIKPLGYLNLIGDGLHNFFDGVAIAASFMASMPTGITTTIAVIFHEIPQEIGDYTVLIYSGFKPKRALALNLLSALSAVLGALAFYYFAAFVENFAQIALAFTAGMFIYMATTDLVPELHKEVDPGKSALQLIFILAGIGTIWAVATFLGG